MNQQQFGFKSHWIIRHFSPFSTGESLSGDQKRTTLHNSDTWASYPHPVAFAPASPIFASFQHPPLPILPIHFHVHQICTGGQASSQRRNSNNLSCPCHHLLQLQLWCHPGFWRGWIPGEQAEGRPWRVPEGTRLLDFWVHYPTLLEKFYYSIE